MLVRHRDPRVVPLEVWDLVIDGATLYEADRGVGFGAVLGRAVEQLIDGVAVSESWPAFPEACREIRRVVLVGGAARTVVWRGRVPALVARDAELCAERGGRAILARAGVRGLVVDLGQSRLKIHGPRRRVLARDLGRIPISGRPVDGRGRDALLEFVAGALREAAADEMPEALVLALPCEIGADGAVGTCSYPWEAGEPIVHEILMRAGLAGVPGWLLNDAELAAIGVAEDEPGPGVTLVLTLGFGVGAALVRDAG
jgi:hypothetical protein